MNILEKFSLKGKVSLVTGGERGIGLSIATAFAQAGSDIAIAGLDKQSAPEAVKAIEAEGAKCIFIETDVTKEAQVVAMVQKVVDEFGKIDVLVNNAGISKGAPAEDMSLEQWQLVVDIDMTSVFLVSREVAKKAMLPNGAGSIVNISSMSSIIANDPQQQVNYNAAKSGVNMITKSMAVEWAKRGIRVNAICPGYVRTAISEHRYKDPENPVIARWLSMSPMGRVGTPDEMAGIALYLASDAASYCTGSLMVVDGGYTSW